MSNADTHPEISQEAAITDMAAIHGGLLPINFSEGRAS
jgi:hypothetical protein